MRVLLQLIVAVFLVAIAATAKITTRSDTGHAAGLMPDCPGVMKNATISPKMMPRLRLVIHKSVKGQITIKSVPMATAHQMVLKDKHIDLKRKKTLIYAVGFLDSNAWPHTRALANTYVKKGYNVFVTETIHFLSFIYPISVRLSPVIGKKLGEFMVNLKNMGLEADNLELIGVSMGSHIAAYAAKHFYQVTGEKPHRLTGLDPAGPCYRNMPPESRFSADDAQFVDVIHTNIDGFGMAEPIGHVDFYANGGEFQPSDIPHLPCLVICSHLRAVFYWWLALENPKKFIALICDSVEDARFARCYDRPNEINYLGMETNFSKPGVYYLSTSNAFPYYRGKEGLKSENEIYTSFIRQLNKDDLLVV